MDINKPLWSDGKTGEDIDFYAELDSDNVIYNLYEDVLCLKEELSEIEGTVINKFLACMDVAITEAGINNTPEVVRLALKEYYNT